MNILITGSKGFIGQNLTETLKNIRDGKDKTRGSLVIDSIFEYTEESDEAELDSYCKNADFVFHLAGVNRPEREEEFFTGNAGFTQRLIDSLTKCKNTCPVMISSSIQARLDNPYGKSKRAGEELLRSYAQKSGAKVLIYRFPNVFGKWCRPNYNSAVATFCHNIANDLPIMVNNRETDMTLVYIDDVVDELVRALNGNENTDGDFCSVPIEHNVKLGEIADLLYSFKKQPDTLVIPEIPAGSFEKKLYSTYLSYLPVNKISVPLKMNTDSRGSFTELFKSEKCGQVSINISKPGVTKGQHWHNTKWEFFIIVSGRGLVQLRKINTNEIIEFELTGDDMQAIHMLPGYTHNIINLSDTENLVTVMWANEQFDPEKPDTFYEEV